jgi:hypothetical protein
MKMTPDTGWKKMKKVPDTLRILAIVAAAISGSPVQTQSPAAIRQNNRLQIFDQNGGFIAEWKQFGRPSGIFIDGNDVLYVADSESRDGNAGYGYNPGARRGIRIGSARDGSVEYFIRDPAPYPPTAGSTSPEGAAADERGTIYGAEFTMDVKRYLKK